MEVHNKQKTINFWCTKKVFSLWSGDNVFDDDKQLFRIFRCPMKLLWLEKLCIEVRNFVPTDMWRALYLQSNPTKLLTLKNCFCY